MLLVLNFVFGVGNIVIYFVEGEMFSLGIGAFNLVVAAFLTFTYRDLRRMQR